MNALDRHIRFTSLTTPEARFELINTELARSIRATISRQVSRDAVDDVEQEVMTSIWTALSAGDGPDTSLDGWIRGILRSAVRDHRRDRTDAHAISLDEPIGHDNTGKSLSLIDVLPDEPVGTRPIPFMALVAAGKIKTLSPALREVFELRYRDDLPIQEIAIELKISVNSVKNRLARLKDALRAAMAETDRQKVA